MLHLALIQLHLVSTHLNPHHPLPFLPAHLRVQRTNVYYLRPPLEYYDRRSYHETVLYPTVVQITCPPMT